MRASLIQTDRREHAIFSFMDLLIRFAGCFIYANTQKKCQNINKLSLVSKVTFCCCSNEEEASEEPQKIQGHCKL